MMFCDGISESNHNPVITVWANLVFAHIQWIIYNWQGTPDAPRWAITRIAPTTSEAAWRDVFRYGISESNHNPVITVWANLVFAHIQWTAQMNHTENQIECLKSADLFG